MRERACCVVLVGIALGCTRVGFFAFPGETLSPSGTTSPAPCNVAGAGPFAGGSGSLSDPYLVCDAAQLDAVRTALAASFRLTADIDLSTFGTNGFSPIGSESTPFTGVLDGDGHTLRGLTIDGTDDQVGLVAVAAGTSTNQPVQVTNLRLETFAVGGHLDVGCLVGRGTLIEIRDVVVLDCDVRSGLGPSSGGRGGMLAGTLQGVIEGCQVSGTVDGGEQAQTGGLVGASESGGILTIRDTSVVADVSGGAQTGGFVGDVRFIDLNIIDSSVGGSVGGRDRTGGFVGGIDGAPSVFSGLEMTASVTGGAFVGGIVGAVEYCPATIRQARVSGSVSGADRVGGLVGWAVVANSLFAESEVSGVIEGESNVGGAVGTLASCVIEVVVVGPVNSRGDNAGGLVGAAIRSTAHVRESYALGDVQADGQGAGGVVGMGDFGTFVDVYATGTVSAVSGAAGGVAGLGGGSFIDTFWNTETSGLATSPAGTGVTTAAMQTATTFPTWDFTGVWVMPATPGPPELRWRIPGATTCSLHTQIIRPENNGSFRPNGVGGWTVEEEPADGRHWAGLTDVPALVYRRFTLERAIPADAEVLYVAVPLRGEGREAAWGGTDALEATFEDAANPTTPTGGTTDHVGPGGTRTATSPRRWPAAGGLTWIGGPVNSPPNLAGNLQTLLTNHGGLSIGQHLTLWLYGAAGTTGVVWLASGESPDMLIVWRTCP